MSQPIRADETESPEPDPLLAFFAEQAKVTGSGTGNATASQENPAKSGQPRPPVEPVEAADASADVHFDLRQRLDRAERLVERSMMNVTALKSELATLVSAVEDIKKRQSRLHAPVPSLERPGKRTSGMWAMLAAVALLTFALLGWGLMAIVSTDLPELGPIESEAAEPAAIPTPAGETVRAPATVREVATPDAAPPRLAPRTPTSYFGTLTVDASPAGEVFLNRETVGHTPLRLEKLRAGDHLIWIERDGYRRWTRVVAVAANRVSRVSATLDPLSR